MTITDITERTLSRPYAGVLMEITTNASYVTLWAHRPVVNMDGVLQKPRGAVHTKKWPRQDWPGLYRMAQHGFFPWHPDDEPDLTAYPGMSKQHIDSRKEVLKAFEAYRERYGSDTEPEAVQPAPEPEVKLPEPVFEPVEQRIICGISGCTYEPKSRNANGKPLSAKVRQHSLRLHQKTHKQVATA